MSNTPIRIILVDDHNIVRESWKVLLESNPRFRIVADCINSPAALQKAQELKPDIILIDINLTPINAFTLTQKIVETLPEIRIIGLSVNNLPNCANRMLQLGAHGYLTKTSTLEEIFHGLTAVFNGEKYVCDEVRNNVLPGDKGNMF